MNTVCIHIIPQQANSFDNVEEYVKSAEYMEKEKLYIIKGPIFWGTENQYNNLAC